MMRWNTGIFALGGSLLLSVMGLLPSSAGVMAATSGASSQSVSVLESNPNTGVALQAEPPLEFRPYHPQSQSSNVIAVDPDRQYQAMEGFGGALTDSSAWLMDHDLSAQMRTELEEYFFGRASGDLGLNMLRLPMGASDMSASGNYTYDQMPPGETNPSLSHFSITHDLAYIIPELRSIRRIDPALQIIATPWSPPAWMKTNDSMDGGELLTKYYAVYAQYFVKFLEAYEKAGVPIQYITPQNEPLNDTSTYPGMLFPANDEATFIANDLGPALQKAGLDTKILAYDHNWNVPSYPVAVLKNPKARRYVAGVAWHCYAGAPDAMASVHDQFPSTSTFVTECSGGTWQGGNTTSFEDEVDPLLIHSIRDGAQGILLWNLALDPENGPTNGGCTTCRGIVTIDGNSYTPNVDASAIGLLSRWVVPGARRVASNTEGFGGVENVSFRDPNGTIVTLVFNSGGKSEPFEIVDGSQAFEDEIAPAEALSFSWRESPKPVAPNPVLDTLSTAQTSRGASLILYGTGFGNQVQGSQVDIGGKVATVRFWSKRLIRVVVPSGLNLGQTSVAVSTASGRSNVEPLTIAEVLNNSEWIATASATDSSGDVPSNALESTPAVRGAQAYLKLQDNGLR